VDFLLVLIELFSIGVTAEALRGIIGSKSAISLQRGPVEPKFQAKEIAPSTIRFLSYGIKMCTDISSALSQFIKTDRQTDRRTGF